MPDMAIPCQTNTRLGLGIATHPIVMAICSLGMDILEPFPRAIKGYKYLYVAIDKFTKWPKATVVIKIDRNYDMLGFLGHYGPLWDPEQSI